MNHTPNKFLTPDNFLNLRYQNSTLAQLWDRGIYPQTRLCSIDGCFRKHCVGGLCSSHRWQAQRELQWAKRLKDERYMTWRKGVEDRKTQRMLRGAFAIPKETQTKTDHVEKRFKMAIYECGKRKKNHFAWKLTLEQFRSLCKKECTYCDGKLGRVEWGKGLDRKNNKGDYTIENVLPCCRTCNRIRGDDVTVGEARSMIRHLLELRAVDVAVKPPFDLDGTSVGGVNDSEGAD